MTRSGFVDVEGGRLHYEIAGTGPAVTLIHPGLWDMRTWDREFGTLADAGYRAIRYDVRGYGGSSFPESAYSDVEDLRALLDSLGVDRTALVGCSMGGNIGIQFALVYPTRVWALVPVASGISGFDWPDEVWEPIWEPIEAAVKAGDLDRATDLSLEIWAPLGTEDEAGARIRSIAMDNLRNFELDELGLAEPPDSPPLTRLGEIDPPTLVILGDRDVPEIAQIGALLAAGIPGATVTTIADADHVVNLRQPEAFERALLAFLNECRPTIHV
jgi:pimeloyl-ACP methyl ester carboxylesterase